MFSKMHPGSISDFDTTEKNSMSLAGLRMKNIKGLFIQYFSIIKDVSTPFIFCGAGRVKKSWAIYFLACNRWINSSSVKQKIQKMNDGFPQNLNIFLQILMKILKSRCHFKIIRFFSYYLNELFLEVFLALK